MDEEKEYQDFLKENKTVHDLVNSEYWPLIAKLFTDEINDLQSIMNVEGKDAEEVFIDIKVRKNVVEILAGFLNKMVGQANQYEHNNLSQSESDGAYIDRNV